MNDNEIDEYIERIYTYFTFLPYICPDSGPIAAVMFQQVYDTLLAITGGDKEETVRRLQEMTNAAKG